jgi:hypothetical protein
MLSREWYFQVRLCRLLGCRKALTRKGQAASPCYKDRNVTAPGKLPLLSLLHGIMHPIKFCGGEICRFKGDILRAEEHLIQISCTVGWHLELAINCQDQASLPIHLLS